MRKIKEKELLIQMNSRQISREQMTLTKTDFCTV